MKKFLSIILATIMIISLFPTAFAVDSAETSYVETYKFETSGGNIPLVLTQRTNDQYIDYPVGDTTYSVLKEYHTGYGNRKWRWLATNDDTIQKAVECRSDVFRLYYNSSGDDFLQLNLPLEVSGKPASSMRPQLALALAFEAPDKSAFYVPSLYKNSSGNNPSSIFLKKLDGTKNNILDYTKDEDKVSFTTGGTEFKLAKAIYTTSGDEFVVGMTGSSKDYRFTSLKLTEVLEPVIAFKQTTFALNVGNGDTSNDSVAVPVTITGKTLPEGQSTASDISFDVAREFLVYGSSDENVAKFVDGALTAVGKGKAKIWAETKDGKYRTEATVTVEGELAGRQYVLNCTAWGGDGAKALSAIDDYGTHGWKHFDIADIIEANRQSLVGMVRTPGDSLIFYLDTKGVDSPLAYALSLQAPTKAGFYVPEFDAYVEHHIGKAINWYISSPISGKTSVEDYCIDSNKILTTGLLKQAVPTQVADTVLYTVPGDELISAMTAEKEDYKFFNIYLAEIIDPDLEISLGSTSLEILDKTSISAVVSGTTNEAELDRTITNKPIAAGGVVYKTNNDKVAEVAADGTVTAIGVGEATIWAESKDSLVKSNEVTVTVTAPAPEPDKALTNAFTPDDETDNYAYIAPSMTGLTIGGDVIDAELTANGYNIEAPAEDKEGDKFLYWAKGMETRKKIISFSNKLEGYVPENNGNNFIIAVYEGDIADTTTPEYYNIDGQLIAKSNTAPAYPSIPGLGTAEAWEDCGGNIKVAKYADMERDNVTVTVDGKAQTVPYGTTITCTADPDTANFKCWKKEVNGVSEIVSVDSTYTFKAWETCTVEAVYEAHIPITKAMKIIIDDFTVGSETGIMAEFIGFGSDVVEKGIMWKNSTSETRIAMTSPGDQFTVIADEAGTYTGYAILKSGSTYRMITDGSYTK
ncbi:MAG: hypothetical protein E7441_10220 [Ruminococcaceae bacterium]|nr:hypothetical protein [Oscillospiraceae bacterium]